MTDSEKETHRRRRDALRSATPRGGFSMRKRVSPLAPVLATALLLFVGSGSVYAAPFVVNSTADAVDVNPGDGVCADALGQCTLRAAVMEANALGGADTITLPAGTYTLTISGAGENAAATGDLDVTGNLIVNGAGAASTIIDGGGLDRVIEIRPGATVQINAVTIRSGEVTGVGIAGAGGGILNFAGTLTLTGSVVTRNTAGGVGGGISTESATTTLNSTTVSGNTASAAGGIFNHGAMTVNASTVANNRGLLGDGGGIWNDGGTVTLNNSTVSGNVSAGLGGGIVNTGTLLTLTNSTVAGNIAQSAPGGILNGNNTIANNTIVANNAGGNCSGNPVIPHLSNYNLSSDGTCVFTSSGDLVNTNAVLGPLANNGGPTATHALLLGSPAIDAVPLAACGLSTDQRGVARPQGTACDIGAYEAASTAACVTPPAGMVGWWPMEDIAGSASLPGATSLQDIIGGNDATPSASPVGAAQGPQPVPGVVGSAMHFPKFGNGLTGARVSPQGALANVGAADFTIDAWVLVPPAAANRVHYIVNKFDTGQNKGYALYVLSPGVVGNERLEFKWGDGSNVSTVQTISTLTTGQWNHVAVTFARSVGGFGLDIRLYVNGAQQGQQAGNPPGLGSLVNFVFLEIGWQPSTLDEPISIDELEIFNVALPPSDVQAIYNAGSAGKCKCVTGGQSVDLTVASTGAVFGAGSGGAATVNNPLTVNYSIQGCSGREMFLIVNASILPFPVYFDGSAWLPVPNPLSLITPFLIGGPQTSNGSHTLFSGSLPPGTYDVYLACDLFVNFHLDVTFPPLCLSGAFDHLLLTVQ
jgi:CSLREA domain-containing protein